MTRNLMSGAVCRRICLYGEGITGGLLEEWLLELLLGEGEACLGGVGE